MGNNKLRRRDQANLKPSSKTTTTSTDKHDPSLRPQRISTAADRTFFNTYIKPIYLFAMREYQLFCGMAFAAVATLYTVIHRLYTPRTRTQWHYKTLFASKKSKGKTSRGNKGKSQPKTTAPRKTNAVKPARLPPPQPLATPTPPPGTFLPSESVASVETLKDVAPLKASSPPSPSTRANTGNDPNTLVVHEEVSSAEALPDNLGTASPRNVNRPTTTTLSEAKQLFQLVEEVKSEETVSYQLLSNDPPIPQLTPPLQARIRPGLDRLRQCLETDLRIDAGISRTPALLAIVWNIHFAMAPEYSLPLQNTGAQRFLNSREVATVFLNRYGSVLWPEESQPAPHLIDRSLQFARDGTVDPSRYWEWPALGHPHPKKGSLTDLQVSKLGISVTKFVGLVYDLPIRWRAGVDWDVIALVLDDSEVRGETLGGRFEELPGGLKRQVLRVD
jgi:hypothetical protein